MHFLNSASHILWHWCDGHCMYLIDFMVSQVLPLTSKPNFGNIWLQATWLPPGPLAVYFEEAVIIVGNICYNLAADTWLTELPADLCTHVKQVFLLHCYKSVASLHIHVHVQCTCAAFSSPVYMYRVVLLVHSFMTPICTPHTYMLKHLQYFCIYTCLPLPYL